MTVFITGISGTCGSALAASIGEIVGFDRRPPECALNPGQRFVQGDLSDIRTLNQAINGCSAIIHLAADGSPSAGWPSVLVNNIEGTRNLLTAARNCAVERVVFASSNHAVGMYEIESAPGIYGLEKKKRIGKDDPVRPDSLYGLSKAFGENLGRYFAETGGPKFYALRIGAVLDADNDHPFAYAENGVQEGRWARGSEAYRKQELRLKAIWQSRRDFVQMVTKCLGYDGPCFDIFYGASDNPRCWFDLDHAKTALGYHPADNSETWAKPFVDLDLHRLP